MPNSHSWPHHDKWFEDCPMKKDESVLDNRIHSSKAVLDKAGTSRGHCREKFTISLGRGINRSWVTFLKSFRRCKNRAHRLDRFPREIKSEEDTSFFVGGGRACKRASPQGPSLTHPKNALYGFKATAGRATRPYLRTRRLRPGVCHKPRPQSTPSWGRLEASR